MDKTSRRILAIGLPLCLLAATAGAVAYWSGNGEGSVTATAAADAAPVGLSLKTPITGLTPGGSITVPVTATNPNSTTGVSLSTLAASGLSAGAHCDAVSGATVSVTQPSAEVVLAPKGSADFGTVTIAMANSAVNQDLCKGATFTLTLAGS